MLRVKWNGALSECFSVSNGIKQGGILSPKLFNIFVDVLSQKLNKKTMGCSFNSTIINHLYYADGLALIAPSSNGMQKLITECESYAEGYGLKFNQMKSVLLSFKPINFKMNPCMNICLNGASIPVETSCASQMFGENRAENFETRVWRLVYGFRERLNAPRNSLVICLMNSVAWSSSGLRQKWENIYICSH